MNTFVCYFDASLSLKLGKAACAFIINFDNDPIYQDVIVTSCNKSDLAEATALFFLLAYVEAKIRHGSKVIIRGDAKGVIDSVNNGNERRYTELQLLYKKLKNKYNLKIRHVPREQNARADALARKELFAEGCREMNLCDIEVSENHVLPGPKRFQLLEKYFKQTGKLLNNIRVSQNNKLICGYGEYVILLKANVESWVVSA